MTTQKAFAFRNSYFGLLLATIFPPSTLGVLGRIFGALSIFALTQYALNFGLSKTWELILDIYLVALRATIGLFDPIVRAIIEELWQIFRIKVPFVEGWRHIFVVLQILFVRDAGTAFSDGRLALGVVRLLVGSMVALTAAVLSFISVTENSVIGNMLFAIIPIMGLLCYDIVMYAFSATVFYDQIGIGEVGNAASRGAFFRQGVSRSFTRLLLVSSGSIFIFIFPFFRSMPQPHGGLVAMTAGLIVNAFYWLYMGHSYATEVKTSTNDYKVRFLASEAGRFGLAVLGIIFWFGFFCSVNAGMRLLGF